MIGSSTFNVLYVDGGGGGGLHVVCFNLRYNLWLYRSLGLTLTPNAFKWPRRSIQPQILYTIQEGIAESIPGGDYDAVFSNSVLHWCEDKDAVFKQVKRSLKKGGKFGFVTVSDFDFENSLFFPPEDMLESDCRLHMIDNTHITSTEDLHNLAAENGFLMVISQVDIREWRFNGVNKLVENLMTHFSDVRAESFDAEAMREHYGDGDIVILMPYTTVVLRKN